MGLLEGRSWRGLGLAVAIAAAGCGGGGEGPGDGDGRLTTRELTFPADVRGGSPRFSPDGTRLAHTRDKGSVTTVAVMDTSGGNASELTDDASYLTEMTWNVDGSRVIYAGEAGIRGVAADGSDDGVFVVDAFAAVGPDLSPDGKLLVYGLNGSNMHLADLSMSPPQVVDLGFPAASPRFSPDGKTIAFWRYDEIQLMDLATRATTDVASEDVGTGFGGVDWFSDGKRLVAGTERGLEIITLGPPVTRALLSARVRYALQNVDLSPDDASVAYGVNGDPNLYVLSGF
jgi:dipeptidyl aminopeptidase/acylaminoacyl peptidase